MNSQPPATSSSSAPPPPKSGPWLHAWHDPVASLHTSSSCVRLVDLNSDGNGVLLVADVGVQGGGGNVGGGGGCKMKVYKGTSVVSEHSLLDIPVSLCVFYTDSKDTASSANKNAGPGPPAIAVAAGSYVFIYRHLRPYFKFALPFVTLNPIDVSIWEDLKSNKIDTQTGYSLLEKSRDSGTKLSEWSIDYLALEDESERVSYVSSKINQPHNQQTVCTCMETLNKNDESATAISSLVIGTEDSTVMILDPAGANVICQIRLPSVPSIMAITGLYDVEYRIVVSCRDGKIYTIKNGEVRGRAVLTGTVIELETQTNAIGRVGSNIYLATMDMKYWCFHIKGRNIFNIKLPCPATNIEVAKVMLNRSIEVVILTLVNGEVRLYNHDTVIHVLKLDDVACAVRWGQFGREVNTCVFIGTNGSLTLKMLSRVADLEKTKHDTGPPSEQDVPLQIPKKTKLYVEQCEREVDNSIHMHRTFQRDLCKLRLTTARSYVKIITSGESGISGNSSISGGSTSVRLNAKVIGLGPTFKIKVQILNNSIKPLFGKPLIFIYNPAVYTSNTPTVIVPVLLPGVTYAYEVTLINVDEEGRAEVVRVLLGNGESCVPIVSAVINMPMSEKGE